MSVGLWDRLNLRWQAAVAVLLPCTAVALFSSLYFPRRLNSQAEESLEQKARALGALASAEIAPTLRLIADGLSPVEDLDNIFEGAVGGRPGQDLATPHPQGVQKAEVDLTGTDVDFMAVLLGAGPKLAVTKQAVVRKAVQPGPDGAKRELPITEVGAPRKLDASGKVLRNHCELDRGPQLLMRCYVRDAAEGAAEGVFVAAFKKDKLLLAQRQNLEVGIWSGVGAAVLGLVLAFVFGRALAGPVGLVTQAAREVASGDVTVSAVDVSAASEIRSMAASFNEMLGSLRHLVGQMVSLTGQLGDAARGLSTASKDQENVTSQQAAYAQEIAATFEELSRTAEQISASTEVVETAARNTNGAVEQAKAVVAQVVDEIGHMRTESKEVAEAIQKLNADLQQVSKIAQVINSVAERSDLLALNAALEGTKAGEVGRGFSLVAAEMRKLAENVSLSARDIARIVEKIQESGGEAVAKARVGVAASDKGVEVAEQASEVFERIVELARGTTEAAQQISVATRQQRQSSEQAVHGARNVADLVKQGVDATGRTNRIAQDLQAVAQALSAVTNRFRVARS
ncbi:MAG: methyl-accepting chemotaxis protein [Myxococcales bacterium]|nr:methyl-accepting chemotaxis protein [Myxococcales bacterium]